MLKTTKDTARGSKTPTSEIEDGIAGCFMRKFKMVPLRLSTARPNFHFYDSKTGMDKGKYRGAALVMRVYGDMDKLDLKEICGLLTPNIKMLLIGFNDFCAYKSHDRAQFVVICDKRGCYE